ncbi:MAG: YggS family pyridoxal phosphate-dependent enzyme [Anaerolineaceae bacterium]|nr:YggS family pyridoxal phosphate-dependent enzyme [Anaerolineaceae bacterium]MDE0330032.1 YggS family pyridoxal phosphate-dependent enzyme [Anaerolineaceae bacterium]
MSISANIEGIREQIEAACNRVGRDPSDVTLLAVCKQQTPEAVRTAAAAGLRHFGENRVEEAVTKIPQVRQCVTEPIVWHMVGHIQSRKARHVPGLFQVVHAVDRIKLARRLSALMGERDATLDVLLEVNVSGEASKAGLNARGWQKDAELRDRLWRDCETILALPNLQVRGLMTMAPIVPDMEATRPVFRQLAALRAALARDFQAPLPELSMGMTEDYPVAVEEGATIVRIGRAIFGPRRGNE